MPVYEYELPDGRIAEIESDSEPTQDEVFNLVTSAAPTAQVSQYVPPTELQMPQLDDSVLPQTKFGLPIEPPSDSSTNAGFRTELKERAGDFFREGLRFVPSGLKTAGVIASDPWRATVNMGRNLLDFVAPGAVNLTGESGLTPPTAPPEQQPLYRAGAAVERGLEELFPPSQDPDLLREVVGGGGQMTSMLAGGAGMRALGAGVKGTAAAATTLGAVQEFDDAFTRARRRGDDPDEALRKTLGYTTVASFLENRLGAGRILKQFFPSAVEAAKKLTAMGVSKKIIDNFITQGIEEGGQRFAQNWIVDEAPSLEGVGREALVGGLSGGVVALPAAGVQPQQGVIQPPVSTQQPLAAEQPDNVLRQAEAAFNQRKPDAIQEQQTKTADVSLRQPEVAQESQVEVPEQISSEAADETRISEPVKRFEKEFSNPSATIRNNSNDPSVISTEATGLAVRSMADLEALLRLNNEARGKTKNALALLRKGDAMTEQDKKDFAMVSRVQFPREVIEAATNSGSAIERPASGPSLGTVMGERPLDWKKNPEVRQWLIKNADKLWSGDPLVQNLAALNEGGETVAKEEKIQETGVLTPPAVGFFPRQSEALGLGEPALPPTVETVRQQREQEFREGTQTSPGEKTTPSRGQWFAGDNPTETSRMMQSRANFFLNGRTDEQAIVDLARWAGGDPGIQLDPQAANFAIKDLLVKLNARINSTKNPVDQQQAWNQIDRLAELSRRMGSEDARSLVSRRLAYRQIDWLMPVLAWRNIVQEQWRDALGIGPSESIDEAVAKLPKEQKDKLLKRLPDLNGETAKKLEELSKKAKTEPPGVRRNKVMDEMVKLLQSDSRISKTDLLRDVWYAHVLMRGGTMLNVIAGSYATGASFAALAAIDRAARLHPVQAMRIIGQFLGGTMEGAVIADQIARKGAYHLLPDAEQRMTSLLTGKAGTRFDNLEELLKRGPLKNPLAIGAYTRRFMAALDYIGALGTRDAMVLYGALTQNDQDSLNALDKARDREFNKQAAQQAKDEMGPKASRAEVMIRKREILEEGVSEELKDAAIQTARRAAQNADPRGIPGFLYRAAAKLPFWLKVPTGLAFMRSAMNMVQNAVDYTPGIGAISAARGALPENSPLRRMGLGLDIPLEERRMTMIAQGASLGIAAIASAIFLGDDDDEKDGMEISGGWKGLSPDQRSQLMDQGQRPYSIRMGKDGPWISYKQMPFAPPLAMVGTARDQQRFNKKEWDAESWGSKLTAAYLNGLLYVRDISSLSGVAGMFDANAWSTQQKPLNTEDQMNRWAANSIGRGASGYIPSVIKEIDEFSEPTLHRPNKDESFGWWLRNVPYARRTVGPGPALNVFGEPIKTTQPPIKAWVGFGKDGELYETLGNLASKGIFLPEPSNSTKIVDSKGTYRNMTEDEWYEFIKVRGPMFKANFSDANIKSLRDGNPDTVKQWLSRVGAKANEDARLKMFPLTRVDVLRRERPASGIPQ